MSTYSQGQKSKLKKRDEARLLSHSSLRYINSLKGLLAGCFKLHSL